MTRTTVVRIIQYLANQIGNIQKIIFFSIILFLPIQLGKHFWPHFSFVTGVRIDYLSPTLYVTDLFVTLLFAFSIANFLRTKKRVIFNVRKNTFLYTLCALFVLDVVAGIVRAKSPLASVFAFVKLLEFSFLGFYVAKSVKKKDIPVISTLLAASAAIVSVIAIWQFIKQQSIGGLLYFLGERTFTSSTIGIANMNIDGALVLRPYATFPHPNVLAFFLFFANIIFFPTLLHEKEKGKKLFLWFALFLSSIALFLTFSRVITILYLVVVFYMCITYIRKRMIVLASFLLFVLLLGFSPFFYRFFDTTSLMRDWSMRKELIDISISLFKDHPYFGVGLKNFFYYQPFYQKTITPTLFQPVHNIFMLVLVETGIIGFIVVWLFLIKTLRVLLKNMKHTKDQTIKGFYRSVMIIFFAMIIVGMFDHFFLTLQQGQLMMAFILGFAWTRMK